MGVIYVREFADLPYVLIMGTTLKKSLRTEQHNLSLTSSLLFVFSLLFKLKIIP